MSSTITSGTAARPSLPSPGRLPVPTRDRRPALAALAVLLIVGGALASGLIVYRSGQRSDFLVLRHDVAPGQRLTNDDLGIARIAGTGARAIPASQRQRVVGQFATARSYEGALLTPQMVEAQRSLPDGTAVVGLTLDASQAPAGGVQLGDVVRVLQVPQRGADGTATVLVKAARVTASSASLARGDRGVTDLPSSTGITISVLVPDAVAASVAAASSAQQAAVVLLPPSTPLTTG